MIDINVINAITIGIISLAAWALLKFILKYFGVSLAWLD